VKVLSGMCINGPKHGQMLASMQGVPDRPLGSRVTHPDDDSGFYVHRIATGTNPAAWIWVVPPKKGANE
jgi:hypothetical protein